MLTITESTKGRLIRVARPISPAHDRPKASCWFRPWELRRGDVHELGAGFGARRRDSAAAFVGYAELVREHAFAL